MSRAIRRGRFTPGLPAVVLMAALLMPTAANGEDWPMWRHDAQRGATTKQELPSQMHLQWVRQLPAVRRAWPDQVQLAFDRQVEPIVARDQMFIGSSTEDSISAYSTKTGARNWTFFAEGPVRFAPVAFRDPVVSRENVAFVSDDGYLYCLNAVDGALIWKVRGGPTDRKIIGNDRIISTWPARGGPVLADSTLYFAASIWPFMGIFIHAVDAGTGDPVWTSDGDGSNFIVQPHGAGSFAGVTPQGALCVAGDKLLVPGGRSTPACLDRRTGKQLYFKHGGRHGNSDVFAFGPVFINAGRANDLETGDACGTFEGPMAFDAKSLYRANRRTIRRSSAPRIQTTPSTIALFLKRAHRSLEFDQQDVAFDAPALTEMIRAGSRIYGAKDNHIYAIDLPPEGNLDATRKATVSWQTDVEGQVVRLLAADDRLFAVTLEGHVYCFGEKKITPKRHAIPAAPNPRTTGSAEQRERAKEILRATKATSGYCVLWGVGDGGFATELINASDLFVVAVEPDAEKAAAARRRFRDTGIYGQRVSVLVGDPLSSDLPPYLARLMVAVDPDAQGLKTDAATLEKLYGTLRPYGGTACFDLADPQRDSIATTLARLNLPQASIDARTDRLVLSRVGALPGSADWTHEHADAANTRVSRDQLVKAPLGVLWFGGPSHDPVLPRHGHGPQPQVVEGRLIIEGPHLLRCIDIYTGRVLWERDLPDVGQLYNHTDHHAGANGTGANYISTPDGIYVLYGKDCLRLDPDTGKTISKFRLPARDGADESADLCYINVSGNMLVLGSDAPTTEDSASIDGRKRSLFRGHIGWRRFMDYISCERLSVLDRHSGKVWWSIDARFQFRNNAICIGGGRLYCVDLFSEYEQRRIPRRDDKRSQRSRLLALDLKTGRTRWETEEDVFGTWLSYSDKHDVLLEAGRNGPDTLIEAEGMRAYRARDGKRLWKSKESGPAMVHGDRILNDGRGFEILTGHRLTRIDPITGVPQAWKWQREYGCNTPQASEHLLVFRSGAAGFYDLARDGGTGNLGGFKSSCTNNLIIAGGVLTAPDYTRTCSCAYQNQTSLALIHMPSEELWTFTPFQFDARQTVRRLGINFGAPGDRRTDEGTLWIDIPSVGGRSPDVNVQVTGADARFLRRHASQIASPGDASAGLRWVAASGVIGAEKIKIPLGASKEERSYRVVLHFAELESKAPRERTFSVSLQGQEVLHAFDIAKAAGGGNRTIVKAFDGIEASTELILTFQALRGEPLVCGVEVLETSHD